jgi:TetR/AcrR family transcriptional repressor of nem operon
MPLSTEHKARTREQIVSAAAGLMRRHGPSGIGVAQVMKQAGLTHGGFYAHFASKDELVAEAFEAAVVESGRNLTEGLEDLEPAEQLRHYVGRYLSRAHRDNPGEGCPLTALGSELSRGGPSARHGFEHGMRKLMDGFAKVLPATPATGTDRLNTADDDDRVLNLMSMMVGGLMLSRAVGDQTFSDHILRTTRRAVLDAAGV